MKKVEFFTYGRNSSDQQTTSQDIQTDVFAVGLVSDWVKNLVGGIPVVVQEYRDHGKSASRKKSKRDDYIQMMQDMRTIHRGRILAIPHSSRLTRMHPVDAMSIPQVCKEAGVRVLSLDEQRLWDFSDTMAAFEWMIRCQENHEYVRRLASGTLRGKLHRIDEGRKNNAKPPYGMATLIVEENGTEKVYGRLEKYSKPKTAKAYLVLGDELEQSVVLDVFSTFANESISFCGLATRLNKHESPLVRLGPTGKGWNDVAIRYMLANPHYNGWEFIGRKPSGEHYRVGPDRQAVKASDELKPQMHMVRAKYQPIVPDSIYNKVQEKLTRLSQSNSKPKTNSNGDGHPLTGILVCGNCGHRMYARRSENKTVYICRNAARNKSHNCGYWRVDEDQILPFLIQQINKDVLRQLADQPPLPKPAHDTERLQKEIASLERKISTIKAKIVAVPDAADTLTDVLVDLSRKLRELQGLAAAPPQCDQIERERLLERWEALIQPMLIPVVTSDLGRNDDVVHQLGIQDEIDRLFNTSWVRPSVIRDQLQALKCSVELWFKPSTVKGKKYEVDYGRITAQLDGKPIKWNVQESRHGDLDIPFGCVRLFFKGSDLG